MTKYVQAGADTLVDALADHIESCAAWSGNTYYPTYQHVTQADLPVAVISDYAVLREPIAVGVVSISSTFAVDFVLPNTYTIATAEAFAATICEQLRQQETGLPWVSLSYETVTVPQESKDVTDADVFVMRLSIEAGTEGGE